MKRTHLGASTTEYALILGLIVILAIPAILLLGGNISSLLELAGNESNQAMDSAMSLLDEDSTIPGTNATAILGRGGPEVPAIGTLKTILNPDGTVSFSIEEDPSLVFGGENATSGFGGTQIAAAQLGLIRNQIKDDPDVDQDVKDLVYDLWRDARKLANFQKKVDQHMDTLVYLNENRIYENSPGYDSSLHGSASDAKMGLSYAYQDFMAKYKELQTLGAQNDVNKHQRWMNEVTPAAKTISLITERNALAQIHSGNWNNTATSHMHVYTGEVVSGTPDVTNINYTIPEEISFGYDFYNNQARGIQIIENDINQNG